MNLVRMAKRLIKRPLQAAAAALGPHRRPNAQGALVVLTYHRILPLDDPRVAEEQPGMIVSPETLRLHLRVLKQYMAPVRLQDWIARNRRGAALPDKAFAVTFDDGWRDNYEFAFDILKQEQVPATLFLVSDLVGTAHSFWPERLARVLLLTGDRPEVWTLPEFAWLKELGTVGDASIDRDRIDATICAAKRYPDAELHQRIDRMQERLGVTAASQGGDVLNWDQVRSMVGSGLVDIGSHTRRHIRMLPGLEESVLQDEIAHSKRDLEAKSGCRVEVFCYPNGDRSAEAEPLVRRHYSAACTTARGWNGRESDPYALRRIGLHEDVSVDRTAFLARISGWL